MFLGSIDLNRVCRQSVAAAELRKVYGTNAAYLTRVRRRVDELTREGWSLPLYREQIFADASQVNFQGGARFFVTLRLRGRSHAPRRPALSRDPLRSADAHDQEI